MRRINRIGFPARTIAVAAAFCIAAVHAGDVRAQSEVFTPDHVAKLRSVGSAVISPDGSHIAYTLSVQREPYEDDSGTAWSELHVVDRSGKRRPFITGEVNIGNVKWAPDSRSILFTAKRGDDKHTSLYAIPIDGGEARKVLGHETGIGEYTLSPDGKRVAFTATDKRDKDRKKLEEKGFNAEIYEEDWREVRVWIGELDNEDAEPRALELPGTPSEIHWSPVGDQLALALAPTPLIDHHYMFRRVHVVDIETGEIVRKFSNPGKLGEIEWSPDGAHLAVISAADFNDPSASRLVLASLKDGSFTDLLPGLEADVASVEWQDAETIMYLLDVGVHTALHEINTSGETTKTLFPEGRMVLSGLSRSADGRHAAMVSTSPKHPREVFAMSHGDSAPRRLTDSNEWLGDMRFAKQEVVEFKARDGLELQGILVRPLDEEPGKRYPLILQVHGGPESHDQDGFNTRYSGPGQVAAARGFAVFQVNYRGSTGRGVAFSKMGQADYGGKEFDDLVDAVDHLIDIGLVDKDRVGITGGSYGGFATAWCSTRHTERFAAGVMFVGISDQISKAGTTDIFVEMASVHARKKPWEDWMWFLERSPIYYAQQSRTPLLIIHGKADTRVHPSQSMELYRHLRQHGKTPVRLVFYPGEGHGNRKSAGRYDYNVRMLRWFEHYLKGPGGDPPPHEIDYGFDTESDEDEDEDDDDGGGGSDGE